MKSWKTEKKLYHFIEMSKKGKEEYSLIMTGEEVSKWCKMKNENYGYIQGVGGDRSYSCVAVLMTC